MPIDEIGFCCYCVFGHDICLIVLIFSEVNIRILKTPHDNSTDDQEIKISNKRALL